jgi:Zinc finger, C2H2 type
MHRVELPSAPPPAPENTKAPRTRPKQSFTETHSFDVLRSEPGTISLEHIASSKTLQNRSSNASKPISLAGVANGSAPAFRVALLPSSERTTEKSAAAATTDATSDRHLPPSGIKTQSSSSSSAYLPTESSSIVSFSMSDGTNVSKLTVDDSGSYFQEASGGGIFRVDGRGKKHQCPQCPKRFNRPSSLRIHVNTHTGARRTFGNSIYLFI